MLGFNPPIIPDVFIGHPRRSPMRGHKNLANSKIPMLNRSDSSIKLPLNKQLACYK